VLSGGKIPPSANDAAISLHKDDSRLRNCACEAVYPGGAVVYLQDGHAWTLGMDWVAARGQRSTPGYEMISASGSLPTCRMPTLAPA
jgi:hypothetical protein